MEAARAVTFAKYKGPLQYGPLKLAELKPNQLLIKTYSVSTNPIDFKRWDGALKMIVKEKFPTGICFDVAGVVEKVGDQVKGYSVGERVLARLRQSGALADYCIADDSVTTHLPDNVSFDEGAALPLAGQTALQALRAGNLKEGQSILISGGAGGVGTYALQLAKFVFKAGRVVTTCSGGKIEFCKALGADECLDYTKGNPFDPKIGTFDVILDTAGETLKMGGPLIKDGSRVVTVSNLPDPAAFARANIKLNFFVKAFLKFATSKFRKAAAPGVYYPVFLNPNSKDLEELVGYLSEGKVKSIIDSVFEGLDKGGEALDRMRSGRAKGKIIVHVRT